MFATLSRLSVHGHKVMIYKMHKATIVTASELRSSFLSYFEFHQHKILSGSSIIPEDDPSLLFVNAGMNQFKKYYLGESKPPFKRVTTSQLCIRAGGKHNDLENIGFTPRHQTMFEMLGNFSLGDYYKEEAIVMASEFLTKTLCMNAEQLRVSVHERDNSTRSLWKKIMGLRDDQIVNRGDNDNLWSMGSPDSPCGYCTEIFYSKNGSNQYDDWLEIWNLVFMNTRNEGGWIDTGMGCERMLSVLNHTSSNYDTDVFLPLVKFVHSLYPSLPSSHLHIFADHLRTSVILANEVFPSSKGRGYVLRKIIRRMLRYAYINNIQQPFLSSLIPFFIEQMSVQVPCLLGHEERIRKILENEELYFMNAVEEGKKVLSNRIKRSQAAYTTKEIITNHSDTGLPIEMVLLLLDSFGIKYDSAGMEEWIHQENSRNESLMPHKSYSFPSPSYPNQLLSYPSLYTASPTLFISSILSSQSITYHNKPAQCVLLSENPYYPEQAGQEGDIGYLKLKDRCYPILNAIKSKDNIYVIVDAEMALETHSTVECFIDSDHRQKQAVHHTATHMLHSVLSSLSLPSSSRSSRLTLQTGSKITTNEFTFDFYSGFISDRMKDDSRTILNEIEDEMNALAKKNIPVESRLFRSEDVKRLDKGVCLGDISTISKKSSSIRVVTIGDQSREFCCGQHAASTEEVYPVMIMSCQSVAAGIKRIQGKAGIVAIEELQRRNKLLEGICESLNCCDKETGDKVNQLVKMEKTTALANSLLIASLLKQHNPSYCLSLFNKSLYVYEIDAELPPSFSEKLLSLLKAKKDGNLYLLLQNRSFCALCDTLTADQRDELKRMILNIGKGGKGGGKHGILKGVCECALVKKENDFRSFE